MQTAQLWPIGLLMLLAGHVSGQCPVADFSMASTACQSENLFPSNLTPGINNYYWDFCSGELATNPTATGVVTNSLFFRARSMRMAEDGGTWTGFAIDQVLNRLVRLNFGADPSGTPDLVDMGNPGGALNGAFDFQLYQEGGNWFAVIVNSGNNSLVSLNFGSSLQTLSPSVQNFGSLGTLNAPNGIKLVSDAGVLTGFVSNGGTAEIVRLDFGASVTNIPVATALPMPGAAGLRGIDVIRECGRWFGLVTSYDNGKVFWLDFDNGLSQPPQTGAITFFTAYLFPASLALAWDGDVYYAFIQSALGSVYRLDFGSSIIDKNGTGIDFGNLGVSNENFALSMQRQGSTWHAFSVDLNQQRLVRLIFPESCQASMDAFTGNPPPPVTYQSAGTKNVTLEVVSAAGYTDATTKTVTVSASTAPDVDFDITNSCRDHDVFFNSINSSGGIASYLWDFGDASTSGLQNPTHQYNASGLKTVELQLQGLNGCLNRQRKSLLVKDPPLADFTLPGINPVCTNQSYLFTNTSITDPQSQPLWEWRLDGVLVSSLQDLQTTFTTASPKEIRLKALIPGCENEMMKNISTVVTGPLIDFTADDNCAGGVVPFSNFTTGADAGYSWDFGDGSPPSSQTEPIHTYGNAATYTVTLTASTLSGCNNFITRDIVIYSVPQPDFSVGLPPFSCSSSPTLFQNSTPDLTDSNITDWHWEFGDPASSTSTSREPSFVYGSGGSYSVTLTASSDAGCTNSVTEQVPIGTSPLADFTNGPACVNQSTMFADISSGGVQSRTWQIGGSIFGSPNPSFTFASPGTYNVTLTVTGTGGCNDVITKPVVVPALPTLTLQVENACATQQSTFTLINGTQPPFLDDVVGWQWNIAGSPASGNPVVGVVSTAGTSPVSVTTTHASGCVYTQTNNILFHPSPVADFSSAPDRGNAPLTVQFQNQSVGASQYQWLFTTSPPGISTDPSPVYTFLQLGDYVAQLTVVNEQGCSDSKSMPIQVLVPAMDLVLIQFTLSPDGITGKLHPNVTILNNSNIPVSSVEVAIHLAGQATVSESFNVNLDVGTSVSRTLALTVDPGSFQAPYFCAELLTEHDISAADNRQCISFDDKDLVFEPYPNPSSGLLNLDWIDEAAGTARITIQDSQGRLAYVWETPSAAGLNQSVHDLSFLPSGIYFITIQTSTVVQTRRFVRI